MKRLYLLVLLIAVAICVYPAGKNVLDVQVGDSSGVAHFDSVRLVYLYGGAALITDSGGADSLLAYDDSDTFRIVVDNPLKLTGSLIFTDFVFGSGTFGTGKTADTIENTAIAAGDYAFITWTSATDSVYEVGGGYHVTILEDSIIVTTSFEETGTTYDYLVK
jgi:hypothetical protein